jgi:peptidyl-prolyl isomerase H (cyclophilin H)
VKGNGSGEKVCIYNDSGLGFQPDIVDAPKRHDAPGLLSMLADEDDKRIGSQFLITCKSADWLDGKHVVIGTVVEGMMTVRKMEAIPCVPGSNGSPIVECVITECGEM